MSTRRWGLGVVLAVACGAGAALVAQPSTAPRADLVLAVLPCTNIEATFQKFYPLVQYLDQSAGARVKLVAPSGFSEFEHLLKNGQVDLAIQDPHTFAALARAFDRTLLLQAVAADGSRSQSGVVVVRRDSGLTALSQLRGRRVVFGPRTSTSKWIAARLLFETAGLDVGRDLVASNGGCCEDIAFAVAIRSADAGVVCDHFAALHDDKQQSLGVDMRSLKVIGRTRTFPSRVLAVRTGAPPDVVGRVLAALLRLDGANQRHARILSAAELRGFHRTTESEYLKAIGPVPGQLP
jgi:phosphonate transport system substrate-binding protein